MEAEVTDPGSDGSGGSSLTALMVVAWAMALSSFAGGAAWLLLTGDSGSANGASPKVTMSLNSFHVADPLPNESATVDAEPPTSDAPVTSGGTKAPQAGGETQLAAAGLHPHPDPLLIEKSDLGLLPIVGKDGRLPWRVYARPFNSIDSRPRIAVIITGLGVSENATKSALDLLPGPVTLSFAPFTKNLPEWIDKSRSAGHEVMIDLPMEPMDYPLNDPGPNTLLTSVPIDQNLRRLGWILSRATGYVGVSIYMGSGMVAKPRALSPILSEIKTRGLMLVDTREDPMGPATDLAKELNLAVAVSDALIDRELAAGAIDRQLAELEQRARAQGSALAVARPFPLTLNRLKAWTASLNAKGIALAPVSALPAMQTKQ